MVGDRSWRIIYMVGDRSWPYVQGGESVQSLPTEHLISQFRHHLGRFALSNPSIAERQRPPPPSSTQSPAAHRHRTLSHSPLGPLRQGTPVISMKWEQNSLHNGMRRVSCAAATNEQSRPRRALKAPWFCLFSIGRGDVRVTRLLQPCYLLGAKHLARVQSTREHQGRRAEWWRRGDAAAPDPSALVSPADSMHPSLVIAWPQVYRESDCLRLAQGGSEGRCIGTL